MNFEDNENNLAGSHQKINEYIERVKQGESIDSFQLPPLMRSAVEQGLKILKPDDQEKGFGTQELLVVPLQYKGLDSETLDFIWDIPEYVDHEKTIKEKERKQKALAYLREQEKKNLEKRDKQLNEQLIIERLQNELRGSTTHGSPHAPSIKDEIQTPIPETTTQLDVKQILTSLQKKIRPSVEELTVEEAKEQAKLFHAIEYWKRRHDLSTDLFSVGKAHLIENENGEEVIYETIGGEIGKKFDAHGIVKLDQLDKLLALLDKGIDPSKTIYTAPFEIPDDQKAGIGAGLGTSDGSAYKEGIAVITSGYNQSLAENGIKHVFINDVYKNMRMLLAKAYPKYQFHLLSEQKKVLEKDAQGL